MKTTFTARHFDASKDLHEYSIQSVQKLNQFYDRIVTCDIILEPVADDEEPRQAELNVEVPQKLLNTTETASTYEQAINRAVETMSRQLKKYKEKNFTNY